MTEEGNKKKEPWGAISCERAEKLMKKQETYDLDPFERNALFAHCTVCDVCREKQRSLLNKLISDTRSDDNP